MEEDEDEDEWVGLGAAEESHISEAVLKHGTLKVVSVELWPANSHEDVHHEGDEGGQEWTHDFGDECNGEHDPTDDDVTLE